MDALWQQMNTETKTVPISSAEAKLYLSQQSSKTKASPPSSSNAVKLRPPFARLSAFDPNPPTKYPRAFSAAKNLGTATKPTQLKGDEGPKLNTVEKSKMDWAEYVDREGIQDERIKVESIGRGRR